jgi:hypothetical protein
MNLDMEERAMVLLRAALAMERHAKAAGQPRRESRDGGLAGRDARLDVVTMEVQDEGLVGAPAQLDALALGCAQHALRRRHAALRDAKLERPDGGLWAFGVGDDR